MKIKFQLSSLLIFLLLLTVPQVGGEEEYKGTVEDNTDVIEYVDPYNAPNDIVEVNDTEPFGFIDFVEADVFFNSSTRTFEVNATTIDTPIVNASTTYYLNVIFEDYHETNDDYRYISMNIDISEEIYKSGYIQMVADEESTATNYDIRYGGDSVEWWVDETENRIGGKFTYDETVATNMGNYFDINATDIEIRFDFRSSFIVDTDNPQFEYRDYIDRYLNDNPGAVDEGPDLQVPFSNLSVLVGIGFIAILVKISPKRNH